MGDVVIIGYGTAAVNAITALREDGYDGRIVVLTDTADQPYSPVLTSYVAGGSIPEAECFPWPDDDLAELSADIVFNCRITGLDPTQHIVRTETGDVPYEKCLIASGSSPIPVELPGAPGYRPLMLRTLDDARTLRDVLAASPKPNILVSGTSMVALKAVEACLDQHAPVTLLGRSSHILKAHAIPQVAQLFEDQLAAQGVTLRLGDTIADVARTDNGQLAVTFASGATDTFDAIIAAHGSKPNLGFLAADALETSEGLLIDAECRTSDPDIYAAGDVAQGIDLATGKPCIIGLWKSASRQGEVAGRVIAADMAGRPVPADARMDGFLPSNIICVRNAVLISAGRLASGEETAVETFERGDCTVAAFYEGPQNTRKLVGFNVFSAVSKPGSSAYDEAAALKRRLEQAIAAQPPLNVPRSEGGAR